MKFSQLLPWNWGKKKEQDYPSEYAVVKLTDNAKENFINDNLNKVIVRYKNGIPKEIIEYTEEELKALQEIYEIPIIEEDLEEEFDFYQESNFGELTDKR